MCEFGPLWLDDFLVQVCNNFSALSEVRYDYIKVEARELLSCCVSPRGAQPVHSAAATDEPLLPRRYCRGRGDVLLEEWRDALLARPLPPVCIFFFDPCRRYRSKR